ncbi:MAG TPA: ribosome maturation factor RimM [Parafilimonas sp.]|nr:ribosome maturation factor RimM [Parafilimonas sp.]
MGKLVATHGFKGEMVLKHVLGKQSDFKNVEAIFIEDPRDAYLPFFHEKSIPKNISETIIKLEGIDTKEAAVKFLQKKVWLQKNDFEKLVSKTAPVNLIGFTVVENGKSLGAVEAVIEQPLQVLLQIRIDSAEVLIPLHDQTLKKIDRKKKEVHVILPEGLLDIYLQR